MYLNIQFRILVLIINFDLVKHYSKDSEKSALSTYFLNVFSKLFICIQKYVLKNNNLILFLF